MSYKQILILGTVINVLGSILTLGIFPAIIAIITCVKNFKSGKRTEEIVDDTLYFKEKYFW